jgi:hypothetical protein
MIPLLLLVLALADQSVNVTTIEFRTMESCESAAIVIEREYASLNARAICIDRSIEVQK